MQCMSSTRCQLKPDVASPCQYALRCRFISEFAKHLTISTLLHCQTRWSCQLSSPMFVASCGGMCEHPPTHGLVELQWHLGSDIFQVAFCLWPSPYSLSLNPIMLSLTLSWSQQLTHMHACDLAHMHLNACTHTHTYSCGAFQMF